MYTHTLSRLEIFITWCYCGIVSEKLKSAAGKCLELPNLQSNNFSLVNFMYFVPVLHNCHAKELYERTKSDYVIIQS